MSSEQQRKFFASKQRFRIASPRRHGHYAQKQREATLKAIGVLEAKNNLEIIVIDECKDISLQDIEKLRNRMELQGFIQTENSDWLREYIDNP